VLNKPDKIKSKQEKWTYDLEVQKIFEKNPHLMGSSMIEIAKYFFIQGELHQSNAMEGLRQKFIHFTKVMTDEDFVKADSTWKKATEL